MKLPEYAQKEGWAHSEKLELTVEPQSVTPGLMRVMQVLDEVGVLSDDALMSIAGQAPVDPLGMARLLRTRVGGWTLQPLNATVIAVLAKVGGTPVALCVVDLISSAVALVARRGGELSEVDRIGSDVIEAKLQELRTESAVLDWLEEFLRAAVVAGTSKTVNDGGTPK